MITSKNWTQHYQKGKGGTMQGAAWQIVFKWVKQSMKANGTSVRRSSGIETVLAYLEHLEVKAKRPRWIDARKRKPPTKQGYSAHYLCLDKTHDWNNEPPFVAYYSTTNGWHLSHPADEPRTVIVTHYKPIK